MNPDEVDEIRDLVFDISKEEFLEREGIEKVVSALRRLMDAYGGATRRLFKLRSKIREER